MSWTSAIIPIVGISMIIIFIGVWMWLIAVYLIKPMLIKMGYKSKKQKELEKKLDEVNNKEDTKPLMIKNEQPQTTNKEQLPIKIDTPQEQSKEPETKDIAWVRDAMSRGWKRKKIVKYLLDNGVNEKRITQVIVIYNDEKKRKKEIERRLINNGNKEEEKELPNI